MVYIYLLSVIIIDQIFRNQPKNIWMWGEEGVCTTEQPDSEERISARLSLLRWNNKDIILPPQFCHQHHPLFTKELQHIMAWPLPFLQNLSHRDYGERRSIPARLLFAQGRVLEGGTQKKVWSLALHRLTVHSTQRWKNWQGIKTKPINCITKENKG